MKKKVEKADDVQERSNWLRAKMIKIFNANRTPKCTPHFCCWGGCNMKCTRILSGLTFASIVQNDDGKQAETFWLISLSYSRARYTKAIKKIQSQKESRGLFTRTHITHLYARISCVCMYNRHWCRIRNYQMPYTLYPYINRKLSQNASQNTSTENNSSIFFCYCLFPFFFRTEGSKRWLPVTVAIDKYSPISIWILAKVELFESHSRSTDLFGVSNADTKTNHSLCVCMRA